MVSAARIPVDGSRRVGTPFVPEIGYSVAEHDPQRPWIIVSIECRTVQLDDVRAFGEWAERERPSSRCSVTPDPWSLSQE